MIILVLVNGFFKSVHGECRFAETQTRIDTVVSVSISTSSHATTGQSRTQWQRVVNARCNMVERISKSVGLCFADVAHAILDAHDDPHCFLMGRLEQRYQ